MQWTGDGCLFQSIPKLYPIVGLRKELPGIALPTPIPLDLPKLSQIKKVREQLVQTGTDLGTVPGNAFGLMFNLWHLAANNKMNKNELVMAAYSTQSIPNLYQIVGLCKELPGIALPSPIPLDLPKLSQSRKITSTGSQRKTSSGLETIPRSAVSVNVQKSHSIVSNHSPQSPRTW